MSNNTTEFHEFDVDKSIVSNLIHSQNGTAATAVRELVMNAIDAGSPNCVIKLGSNNFEVRDTGKGFEGRESVEKFFKRFGEPHKEGDAIFGRFRIGRGQIMAFGKITWHSNEFKMITDVANKGNGFDLVEDKNDIYCGCKITGEFYEEIKTWDLRGVKEDLAKLVKYADQEITYNGFSVSHHGKETLWDFEDDEVKIKWDPERIDGIHLYSLGVFVKEVSRYAYGINADIVTKKALKLNMARNEISEHDALWKKICNLLKERSLEIGRKNANSKNLDEDTRRSLIYQFLAEGLTVSEISRMALLRDCRGHTVLINNLWGTNRPITIAPEPNHRIAERIASNKAALVLHADELRIWGFQSVTELLQDIQQRATAENYNYVARKLCDARVMDFSELAKGINDKMSLLKNSELNKRQVSARSALEYASGVMAGRLNKHSDHDIGKRKIIIGESDVAHGWTDGLSYIAINREMLSLLDSGYYGAVQLSLLLLHEYCHDNSDVGSHEHNFAFYEKFHDLSSSHRDEILGHTASSLFSRYQSELGKRLEKLPNEVIKQFKWPVVNNIHEFTGQMRDKKLSPIALMILDFAGIKYKVSKTKFEARISYSDDYNIKIKSKLNKLVESDGFELPNNDGISLLSGSYEKIQKAYKERAMPIINKWAITMGHDPSIMEDLFFDFRVDLKMILRLICQDKNSGLIAFEGSELYPTRIACSDKYAFTFKSSPLTGWSNNCRMSNEEMALSKDKRWEYALQGIKDIANSFTDEQEKEEFVQKFLSENTAIQLNQL